ncbi:hypothetical protein Rhopal_007054-T1 [Rhodotorula paludigena]|uniref:Phospholipid/glycerol acyltransferase domain-containing protein n=1 Tax=Rhodotorula paludigena TaxID=86838 RepID=A0AAV5GN32_9BASI|nr:hypothetical protein Rhopal_007054-T1 [Rhodotorula paludigena]
MPTTTGFGHTHTVLRGIAAYAFMSFWHKVQVLVSDEAAELAGTDDPDVLVPDEGTPMIVVANHWNSAADVAVLSCYFPHYRKLHYWAKSTLFAPGLPRTILLDAGNIPVDRKTKDNQKLFAATFDALKAGEAIAVFPEGGSETVHTLPALKDGASWAALEYAKNIRDPQAGHALSDGRTLERAPVDVTLCIAGIGYSDKTKYRACATMEFGLNISVEPYVDEFLVSPKSAVKKLTQKVHDELTKVTVNAPDWETRHAAMMARKVLWPDDRKLPLKHLRKMDQALVDLFAAPAPSRSLRRLCRLLNDYRDALNATGLSHLSLSSLPLPATLDPDVPHPLPTRFRVLASVLLSTLSCLIRLPFFLLPLIVHLPVYLFARYASSGALEEDQAQNKVAIGLVLALATYAAFFAVVCALLWTSIPWGGALIVGVVGLIAFVAYHNRLVDDNFRQFQRLSALWTVLFALWTPVAREEASHFLHSVHPSLSPLPPRAGGAEAWNADLPYGEGGTTEEEEDAALLGGRSAEDDDDDDEEVTDGATDQGTNGLLHPESSRTGRRTTRRTPLPSPALFSEQDRLLGGPMRPRPSSSSSPSPSRRAGTSTPDETTIEMPPLSSSAQGAPPAGEVQLGPPTAAAQQQPPRRRTPRGGLRSRARAVRELLRLRAETVASLRDLLFADDAVDDDEENDAAIEAFVADSEAYGRGGGLGGRRSGSSETLRPSTSSAGAQAGQSISLRPTSTIASSVRGFTTTTLGEREVESRRLAREVGARMREWGWRGSGLGSVKLR